MAAFESLTQSVLSLYHFRNNYFAVNSVEQYANKEKEVNAKLEETLRELNDARNECETADKALYYMLYGKALNVKSTFDPLAYELLSKSIKLNPKLTEAWNQLGECYWKKGDLKAAFDCFEGSLKQNKKDKVALRNLSMLLRQIGENHKEKQANLLKSLEIAKEAVAVDVTDGMSWYNLGNACFNLFFASSNRDWMKQCKVAYGKAIVDPVASSQPDFIFNYAICLQYEEMFQESLEYFSKASLLDPSWNEPRVIEFYLQNFIRDIHDMIAKKGSLKQKRIQNLLSALKPEVHLGLHKDKLEVVKTNELIAGINKKKVFLAKIIGCVNVEKMLCHTFCVMDSEQNCIAISIYNLNGEKGPKIGDSLAIPEPFYRIMKINYNTLNISYPSIRVDSPLDVLINGKFPNQDCIAIPRISFTVTSE
ncbi:tetratricopeptide repeat protein 5-like protein [Dinothrombium tinctorium]|uniref:Tetratricopeptide repeat protein 5-like protein n=1 Tax=Dinothrombium tinctorium TaxID=1965070 RepID=A0A443R786_9ACAR|nr:tetratricopeptide repeat protein 5-like protein [Dinothrombium tinctorium]